MTGNRRFLNILCPGGAKKHPWNITQSEIQQIWAEVKFYVAQHESLILSAEAQKTAEKEQNAALETDEREGIIMQFLDMLLPGGWDKFDLNRRAAWQNNPNAVGIEKRRFVSVLEISDGKRPD